MNKQIFCSFDKKTVTKIVKGLLIVTVAIVLTYFLSYVAKTDFGAYTGLVVGLWSVIINVVKEYVEGMRVDKSSRKLSEEEKWKDEKDEKDFPPPRHP